MTPFGVEIITQLLEISFSNLDTLSLERNDENSTHSYVSIFHNNLTQINYQVYLFVL